MTEPVEALAILQNAVDRSKRKSSVQFPISFVRQHAGSPPLAKLMRGGQGGGVRLRLYLTLVMQATRHPYRVPRRTARGLARLLNLPGENGPRQINAALNWLEKERLIVREREDGVPSAFVLKLPDGSGEDWAPNRDWRYLTLPIALWSNGWILRLNGRCLAVYIALRELTGGKPEGGVMDKHRKRQYGISNDTWTRATKELEAMGLLIVTEEVFGDDSWERRRRNRYRLTDLAVVGNPSWQD